MKRAVWFSAVLAGAITMACSSDKVSGSGAGGSPGDGTGGSGATAAAAGALLAEGNLTLMVQPPTSTSAGNCPVPGRTYVIGNPKGPDRSSPGDRLTDGENGAKIKCSVTGSGPFAVSATIQGTTQETPADRVSLIIKDGVIDADTQTGTASVSVFTPQLAGTFSGGDCTLSVINQNIKAGSLWASVTCPAISDPSAPGQACSVGQLSTFVIENCDGS